MKIKKLISCFFIFYCLFLTACETEQTEVKSSSPMASYNEDFAKNQARLMNESALTPTPISNTPTVLDGSPQQISTPTSPNTSK